MRNYRSFWALLVTSILFFVVGAGCEPTAQKLESEKPAHGYAMCNCVTNSQYFDCFAADHQNSTGEASGAEVLDALGVPFEAGKDAHIHFKFRAYADTNYTPPIFQVTVADTSSSYNFPSCSSNGATELVVSIPADATINDLSIVLTSGDWCAAVLIDSIEFEAHADDDTVDDDVADDDSTDDDVSDDDTQADDD